MSNILNGFTLVKISSQEIKMVIGNDLEYSNECLNHKICTLQVPQMNCKTEIVQKDTAHLYFQNNFLPSLNSYS